MKKIGLIGGMSWESTAIYYRMINEGVKAKLGGLHSAKIIMESVDFAEIEAQQVTAEWSQSALLLSKVATNLQRAGAEGILICTNTMHKVADEIADSINIPLLHIADMTANTLMNQSKTKIGLLGTAFTMQEDFYKGRLEQQGISVLIPNNEQRQEVHRVIYQELCLGQVSQQSQDTYLNVIDDLASQGAQCVILGCTEIGLLVNQSMTDLALYDTTEIHAQAAVEFMLS